MFRVDRNETPAPRDPGFAFDGFHVYVGDRITYRSLFGMAEQKGIVERVEHDVTASPEVSIRRDDGAFETINTVDWTLVSIDGA